MICASSTLWKLVPWQSGDARRRTSNASPGPLGVCDWAQEGCIEVKWNIGGLPNRQQDL